ncbi:MAG: DUF512 domain-containing protein [Candidatus Syntrophonatronum acetioxidans]|uniref:DUF512 domain-containing protein n=1 Tax=Candidatus Syntrophonatronum acetioxidans TaxID=1795816 RepID=A0A424Y9W1_9FIRM|nr:MAG: DUF512 domain-containing protein [Candidatus Syntrophonatronum acetioxidans]
MAEKGERIERIEPDSIAEEVGLAPGDRLIKINGEKFRDIIDYRFLCAGEELELRVIKKNGEEWQIDIEKEYDEDLGVVFASPTIDQIKECHNKCIFCFIDQMPGGMRPTLYVKDDDYRLSFLYGNFVTLTNLREKDIERIEKEHLSPLYVSIHATEPALRNKMMSSRKAGKIMELLKRLTRASIEIHGQIVLCPGINDGKNLDRTLHDLGGLWPSFKSVAVVPVGITRYREDHFPLSPVKREDAEKLLEKVARWQERFLSQLGTRFVFPADEFFLKAEGEIPSSEYYEDYSQMENGVGLIRLFLNNLEKWKEVELPEKLQDPVTLSIVTGVLARPYLERIKEFFKPVQGLKINVWEIENIFFGQEVTVAGLICGKDIIDVLSEKRLGDLLLLPDVMVKDQDSTLLDDFSAGDIEDILQVKVKILNSLLYGVMPGDIYTI